MVNPGLGVSVSRAGTTRTFGWFPPKLVSAELTATRALVCLYYARRPYLLSPSWHFVSGSISRHLAVAYDCGIAGGTAAPPAVPQSFAETLF